MHSYITIGGMGTRLKNISPKDKHLLYYKNTRIIEWILSIVPDAKIIGENKTSNRKETLNYITQNNDILIIDCDIIPFEFNIDNIDTNNDCVFVFTSKKSKYGSVILNNNKILKSSESSNLSDTKCSGIYFIKNLTDTISKMTNDNSIISGMIGASVIFENTFMRFGDIEDYFYSIKQI